MGFGSGPFGSGPFGRDDWATNVFVNSLPEFYKQADEEIGGQFITLLQTIATSYDYNLEKIIGLSELRNPLLCPIGTDFLTNVIIIQVVNLGNGTSQVFLSQNPDGLAFNGIMPGFILTDSSGNQFPIVTINSSEQASEFTDPPIDPFTGNPTGKNIIVQNISLANIQTIPLVSGQTFTTTSTNATVPANNVTQPTVLIVTPLDNGSNLPPYTLIVGATPLAQNLVTITWTEGGDTQTGYINNQGNYFGNLTVGTTINYSTGTIVMSNASGQAVDNASISVTYTTLSLNDNDPVTSPIINGSNTGPFLFTLPEPPVEGYVTLIWTESSVVKRGGFTGTTPYGDVDSTSTINNTTGAISFENHSGAAVDIGSLLVRYLPQSNPFTSDATITQQNILVFYGQDYGIAIDQHEPETFQRSSVYNAYQLWDTKGTTEGYTALAAMAGFSIDVERLYRLSSAFGAQFVSDGKPVYFQSGYYVNNEIPGSSINNSISPVNDGTNIGPFTVVVTDSPIYLTVTGDAQSRITVNWTQAANAYSISYNSYTATLSGDTSLVSSFTANSNGYSITFNTAPDAGSINTSYYPEAYYTTLDPNTLIMDDVILDVIPLDEYCADNDFPVVDQTVDIISVSFVDYIDGVSQWLVVASTASYDNMYLSFGTEGLWVAQSLSLYNFTVLSDTEYSFQVISETEPSTATAQTIQWNVLKDIPMIQTDTPGVSPGTTISPTENGSHLGPFTIDLSASPVYGGDAIISDHVTINWTESSVTKTVYITSTSTVGGTNAANISSASIVRSTGVITITFNSGHAPDAASINVVYRPTSDYSIVGVGTDLTLMGVQYQGYTGNRWKLLITLNDVIAIGNVGQWKLIDSNGNQAWIESCTLVSSSPYVYNIQFIMNSTITPATGPMNIFYVCELQGECGYCAASVIRVILTPNTILNYPQLATDVTDGAVATRFFTRFSDMVPAHVRVLSSYLLANFTYTNSSLVYHFTDTSLDINSFIITWSWEFGDSNTSTSQNPSHTYGSSGTYTVTLTVSDNLGNANTHSTTVVAT